MNATDISIDLRPISIYLISMSLSSSQLDAFAEVARTGSFSRAAQNLHITQSALSQRILNLEHELATSLIIRESSGLRLTPAGAELLRYHQAKSSLEQETLDRISGGDRSLKGAIRIAGFSSVMRSVVMPAISELIFKNPSIQVELFSRELNQLPLMLATNEIDFIVTIDEPQKEGIETHLLGYEENVLIEGHQGSAGSDVYFDHDPDDQTTVRFFKIQKDPPKKIRRAYLDEVYAIIDAVSLGWGRAVVPRHLIAKNKSVKVTPNLKPLRLPVYFCYYQQAYYSQLQQAITQAVRKNAQAFLQLS